MNTPVVIQTEHLDPEAAAWLAERAQLIVCPLDDSNLQRALAAAEALVIRTYTLANAKLLAMAPKLKVIGRAGVGLDNIDIAACRAAGIEVVYTPDANTQAVVEYVVALLTDIHRPRVTVDHAIPAAEWNAMRNRIVGHKQLNELTIGILGLGRVGKGVARVMSAIGCTILYHDVIEIPPNERFGAIPVTVEDLFSKADVITVHIDGRETNRDCVGEPLLTRMKPDALFINTSRGFVVDNLSFARLLSERPATVACLDVHEPEPFDSTYPLLGLTNVRLYPHLASRTATAMRNMSWVVRDVWEVLEGRPPRFPAPRA